MTRASMSWGLPVGADLHAMVLLFDEGDGIVSMQRHVEHVEREAQLLHHLHEARWNRRRTAQRRANLRCVTCGVATVRTSSRPCRFVPMSANKHSPLPSRMGTRWSSISSTSPARRY